jgi:hypothetical protein
MTKGSEIPFMAAPRLCPVEPGFQILDGLREAHIVDVGGYVRVSDGFD